MAEQHPKLDARWLLQVVSVAAAYYLFAKLGLRLAYVGSNVTLVWPPMGIAVAALFRLGRRAWPGVFLAAMVVNLDLGSPTWASVLIGAGNTLGAAFVAEGLRRIGFRPFERLRDALGFLGTALVGMVIAPTFGLAALHIAGNVPVSAIPHAWVMWWVGDLNGLLVVGPVLLTVGRSALLELRARWAELALVAATTALTTHLVFFVIPAPIAFAVLVPVVWAALRFPGLGSSSVVLAISAAAVWATAQKLGPFANPDSQAGLFVLSTFLGSCALGNLVVLALLAEQRAVRSALEASEADRLRALEAGAVGMWDLDLETDSLRIDEGSAALWGIAGDALDGGKKSFFDAIHPRDRDAELGARERARRDRTPYEATYRVVRPDGATRWVSSRGRFFYDDAGKAVRVTGVVQDVTARADAEEAERRANERLGLAARLAGFGTWELDVASSRVSISPELAQILAVDRLVFDEGAPARDLVHPDDRERVMNALPRKLEMGATFDAEFRVVRADGEIRHLALQGIRSDGESGPLLSGAALDVTKRKQAESERENLERRLADAQRTESLGRLAGGIAHDFNNLLAVILPNAELLAYDIAAGQRGRESVDAIVDATKRARDLTRQILAFASQRDANLGPVELAPVVEDELRLLRVRMPSSIDARVRIGPCAPVLADPSQVHQIVANLVTNAVQAMGDAGGTLEVELTEVEVEDAFAKAHGAVPGRFARLTVRDTGHGMDAETRARIFDPFFTTKGPRGGTGLGLSVVQAVVRAYGGAIEVESEVGKGSAFSAYLPTTERMAAAETPAPAALSTSVSGHLLLVDDDPAVLRTSRRVLERLGLTVTCAASAKDALRLLSELGTSVDVLLTDQAMPETTGMELAAQARRLRPHLPILVATGYGASVHPSEATALGIHEVLAKPTSSEALAHALQGVLAQRASA